MLAVKLLGQFDVRREGTPVVIPSRAAQSLLAYLLLSAGTRHRREQLAGLLWPESTEEHARNNLRHELWRLRQAIEPKTTKKKSVSYLSVDEISITFEPRSDYWLDASVMRSAMPEAATVDTLIETLSLYGGELLPGFYDEWVIMERERARAIFEQKMAQLMELLNQSNRWQDALEWGERWIALGQTPEPAYRALMLAHHALGNVSQVASVFARCVQGMRDELGVEPSPQTRELFERLSKNENPEFKSSGVGSPSHRKSLETPPAPGSSPLRAPLRNLPAPLTSFVGREKEIEQVKRLLSTTRLLTLLGSGGVGKTRLAIQAVTAAAREYKDGLGWIDLAPLTNKALVTLTVAKALGVPESSDQDIREMLTNYLRPRQMLIVVDNCEHLIGACASLVEVLLSNCLSLHVVVTSREPLGIGGEIVWRVSPLSLPVPQPFSQLESLLGYDAIRLFVERAVTVRPDFSLNDQNKAAVAAVCVRLDGLPLAIELAAARVKMLSIEQILTRLVDRFQLLRGGNRTALPRHQTLRATIDWSYDLLTESERVLFSHLSLFPASFTLEAVEAICEVTSQSATPVLDLLSSLVDKSLVMVETDQDGLRFHLLESIREYAGEKLSESGQTRLMRNRHVMFFLRFAESAEPRLRRAEQILWLERLDREHDNLLAALQWASENKELESEEAFPRIVGALWLFWFIRGYLEEGRQWSEKALAVTQGLMVQGRTRGKALYTAAAFSLFQGDLARAQELSEIGLTLCRRIKYLEGEAISLHHLGLAKSWQGDVKRGIEFLQQGLAVARKLEDKWIIAQLLCDIGTEVASYQGDLEYAAALFDEMLVLARQIGNIFEIAYALGNLGDVALQREEYSQARSMFRESLALWRELGEKRGVASALLNLGRVLANESKYERAKVLLRQSLATVRDVSDKINILECLIELAKVFRAQGDYAKTAQLLGNGDAMRETMGYSLPSNQRELYERTVAAAVSVLGEAAFDAEYEVGKSMPVEQAIARALES